MPVPHLRQAEAGFPMVSYSAIVGEFPNPHVHQNDRQGLLRARLLALALIYKVWGGA